jgi:general secretion pathway protein D
MKFRIFRRRSNAIYLIAISAFVAAATGLPSFNLQAQTTAVARPGEPITLNFNNAEIEAVARAMANIIGANVVVDPRVKGTITLITEKPVNRTVAMNQFLAALRLQGFTMVESAGLYKVVPEADAKLQSGAVSVSNDSHGGGAVGNQITTQIFRLNFESANNLVAVLRPLISPNNTINANPGNNSLVITDYADNLRRIARIIAAMDVANASDVEILPLKHAIAVDLAPLVLRLVESSGAAPGADTSFKTTLVAEPRSNTLILRAANPARVALVKSLVDKLDQPIDQGGNGKAGNIYVVYLKNADATKLAATLRAAMTGQAIPTAAAPAGAGATAATATVSATGGQVQADVATNSLIITAPEPQYRQLRAVIDRLDGRRAQVLVESLIAEVSTDKQAQFGIQWQALLGNSSGNTVGVLGSNFSIGGTNIFSFASAIAAGTQPSIANGAVAGFAHQTPSGFVLGALANLLQSTGDGNVLSTPTLLTLDNEEAKIVIGQNVPFVTGQFTNTGSSSSTGSVNPFTTVERKDVGLTLKVKPQISEDGSVKLVIYQEVSSIQAGTLLNLNGPTTNKRSIESTVMVNDGNIVVLGGLLQDDFSGNQQKVPGLGDMPVFGALFRSDTRERKKTNLMVFLRPVIMRSATDSDALSFDRYDVMRGVQQSAQPTESETVPVNQAPVMAPLPKPAYNRPVPAPLMTPGLSGTWGSAPDSAPTQPAAR